MSWTCPNCNRTFHIANQQHTCTLVTKENLEVEFFLDNLEDQPPVKKFLQTSKHRVAHCHDPH